MFMSVFRRIMLSGGINIDALPDTQKLYYTATAKVTPQKNSLGVPVIANKWDSITGEGIIACSRDITMINNYAFSGVSVLTSITIPDSVTLIGFNAFYECRSLKSITIPDSVTSIDGGAFVSCISLPIVDNIRYADTCLVEVVDKTLTEYTIKDSTRFIGGSAFSGCKSLTSITIPDSVTSIEDFTFYSCISLKSVTIPDSITSIGVQAFMNCKSLTSITIPDSVTEIRSSAFVSCTLMQYYDFSTHKSVPTLANINAFTAIPSTCKIIVPDVLYDEWIAATNWSEYADNIINKSDWDASQVTE